MAAPLLLLRYLHLHYPEVENREAIPAFLPREALDFPRRCADVIIETARELQVRGGEGFEGCG